MKQNNISIFSIVFLSILLCSSIQSVQAINVPGFFGGLWLMLTSAVSDEQPTQPKQTSQSSQHFQQQSPDFKALRSELELHFRKFANIDEQSEAIRLNLYKVKKEIIDAVKEKKFKTHAEAHKMAFDHVSSQISKFLSKIAGQVAEQEVQDATKKHQARQAAEKYFENLAIQRLSNNQSIGAILQNIKSEVATFLHNNFYPAQSPSHSSHTTTFEHPQFPVSFDPQLQQHPPHNPYAASAPPTIQEIFPEGEQAKTLAEFEPKTTTNHIIHRNKCFQCARKFVTIGNRVTLRCGDQICTNCLLKWKFSQPELQRKHNQPVVFTCPFCRREISEKDFSADYISSKLD